AQREVAVGEDAAAVPGRAVAVALAADAAVVDGRVVRVEAHRAAGAGLVAVEVAVRDLDRGRGALAAHARDEVDRAAAALAAVVEPEGRPRDRHVPGAWVVGDEADRAGPGAGAVVCEVAVVDGEVVLVSEDRAAGEGAVLGEVRGDGGAGHGHLRRAPVV